jgi:hypothetical protein
MCLLWQIVYGPACVECTFVQGGYSDMHVLLGSIPNSIMECISAGLDVMSLYLYLRKYSCEE